MSPRIARENPARCAEIVGTVEVSDAACVEARVRRAAVAQHQWAARSPAERAEVLRAAVVAMRPLVEGWARLMAAETGKPLPDCRGEIGFALTVLDWTAGRAAPLLADEETDDESGRLLLRRRPYGVVAAVTPWNAPVILAMLKVAPALVTGNAVVVKPSPLAPFAVAGVLAALAAHVPEGALSVVQGEADTAAALVGHRQVHRVAFTGGEAAGRAIGRLAAQALTPTLLELGGNDPAILLDDAALDDAAFDRLVLASFATSGQVCMAAKRLYVHRSRFADVVEAYQAAARRVLVTGDPLHDGVTMGPVVSAVAAERVRSLVAEARAGGATVRPLGRLDPDTDLAGGYFVAPTLVLGAPDTSRLVAEEQFGPALPVLAYDTVDDVVARANHGDLGLAASVWSADEDRAVAVARRLDAGFTFVNTHNRTGLTLRAPFGGVKRSGHGREYGDEGILEYVQTVAVHAPAAFRPGAGHAMSSAMAAAYPIG